MVQQSYVQRTRKWNGFHRFSVPLGWIEVGGCNFVIRTDSSLLFPPPQVTSASIIAGWMLLYNDDAFPLPPPTQKRSLLRIRVLCDVMPTYRFTLEYACTTS